MTAFADAMVFLVVIMVAISVSVLHSPTHDSSGIGPDDFLDVLGSIEVKLSDLTDVDDDTLVYLIDVMALSMFKDNGVTGYLEDILETIYGGDGYTLFMEFGSASSSIGTERQIYLAEDSRSYPVSTGGALYVSLRTL